MKIWIYWSESYSWYWIRWTYVLDPCDINYWYVIVLMTVNISEQLNKYILSTSEKIAYMYTFKIMFDTSVIQ
jgi:hypothetical protein